MCKKILARFLSKGGEEQVAQEFLVCRYRNERGSELANAHQVYSPGYGVWGG